MKEIDAKTQLAQNSIKQLRHKIIEGSTTNRNKLINFNLCKSFKEFNAIE